MDSLLYHSASKDETLYIVPTVAHNVSANNSMVLATILHILGDKMLGEIVSTVIGLLFMFGSISIFISLIVEKHDNKPVMHSAIDNDLTDVIIADELFDDEN